MYQVILAIHVLAAICLIALVLVQQGKGAMVGASFGSGASQTVFGSRGAGSFMLRLTMTFVAIFFLTSISLNWITSHTLKKEQTALPFVMQQAAEQASVPAAPAAPSQAQKPTQPAPTDLPVPRSTYPLKEKVEVPKPSNVEKSKQGKVTSFELGETPEENQTKKK
ncbi:MAG: preprotein translocase subunit SecG [Gammaproteobacteria bacterium]|nr:preprotein translocase subunit SecG [Gammaproteobacteria bacterium]